MFLALLAHNKKNHIVKYNCKKFGGRVNKHFHEVLNAIIRLHPLLLAQSPPVNEDCMNERWKWLKVIN